MIYIKPGELIDNKIPVLQNSIRHHCKYDAQSCSFYSKAGVLPLAQKQFASS